MSDLVFNNRSLKLINSREYHLPRYKKLENENINYITEPEIFCPYECNGLRPDVWSLGALFIVLRFWKKQNQYFRKKEIEEAMQN